MDCGALLAHQPAMAGRTSPSSAMPAAQRCSLPMRARRPGSRVPEFDDATQAAIRTIAGPNAGVSNPVDLGAGATPQLFERALRAALRSPCDCRSGRDPCTGGDARVSRMSRRRLRRVAAEGRPIVFVHLGDSSPPAAPATARRVIPSYAFPERAVRALGRIADHSDWKRRPIGVVPDFSRHRPDGRSRDRRGSSRRPRRRRMVAAASAASRCSAPSAFRAWTSGWLRPRTKPRRRRAAIRIARWSSRRPVNGSCTSPTSAGSSSI